MLPQEQDLIFVKKKTEQRREKNLVKNKTKVFFFQCVILTVLCKFVDKKLLNYVSASFTTALFNNW